MKPPRSDEDYRPTSPFRRRSRPPRPPRPTSKPDRSPAYLLASDWVGPTDDYGQVSSSAEPRSFPYSVKQLCWEKAETVKGRDPTRWRRDPIGNLVFRKLVGCAGCLCHDYDHIVPYSKPILGRW